VPRPCHTARVLLGNCGQSGHGTTSGYTTDGTVDPHLQGGVRAAAHVPVACPIRARTEEPSAGSHRYSPTRPRRTPRAGRVGCRSGALQGGSWASGRVRARQLPRPVIVYAVPAGSRAAQCGDPEPHTAPSLRDALRAPLTRPPRRAKRPGRGSLGGAGSVRSAACLSVPCRAVVSGHSRTVQSSTFPRSGALTALVTPVPKLMTSRSSLRPPHVLRVLRDQLRDNPAGHGHSATNAHGHCRRAHLHVPARPVTMPVASGRRGRLPASRRRVGLVRYSSASPARRGPTAGRRRCPTIG
jgi:hypothetical protein